jgi:AAA family ATP:ADP antiporter
MINTTREAVELESPTGLRRLLAVFAPVKRSEVVTVVVLTVNVFVLLTCYYVLKVVREPLILLGGGAELKAYASAGQAVLLLGVVPAFGWLSSRVGRLRLLTTMQLIFIGCLVVFYGLAQVKAPLGLAFYLWLGIFNVLVVSNFWSFANDLYTEEQGKRLFAVIGVGASIGAIIGAFVPHMLHHLLGVYALMLVAAGGLAVSIVLYRMADLRERGRIAKPAAAEAPTDAKAEQEAAAASGEGGFTLIRKDRYLQLLAGMLLVATIINTTGEYVVSKLATDRSTVYAAAMVGANATPAVDAKPSDAKPSDGKASDSKATDSKAADSKATDSKASDGKAADAKPADAKPAAASKAAFDKARGDYLAGFFSSYYGLVNLLSALLQALIVARLLTWLGIRRALFIMPMVVLGGWFALLLFANMTLVRVEKTTENSLDYSLHNTLRHALFLPTSRAGKYKAKAAIDTFVFRMGDVIAGLVIVFVLVEVLGLGIQAFAALNVGLAALWLVLAFRAGKLHDTLVAAQENEKHPEVAAERHGAA